MPPKNPKKRDQILSKSDDRVWPGLKMPGYGRDRNPDPGRSIPFPHTPTRYLSKKIHGFALFSCQFFMIFYFLKISISAGNEEERASV